MDNPKGLTILTRPCDQGACPTLYTDSDGRIFVQGNRLDRANHDGLNVADNEDVVEITPELISFLQSQ